MTIRGNLQNLAQALTDFPGPKPDLERWQEWLSDAIDHIGEKNDAPSTVEKAAIAAHEKFLAEHPDLRGGDSSGKEGATEGPASAGEGSQNNARVQGGNAALGVQAGAQGQVAQAGGGDRPQPGT